MHSRICTHMTDSPVTGGPFRVICHRSVFACVAVLCDGLLYYAFHTHTPTYKHTHTHINGDLYTYPTKHRNKTSACSYLLFSDSNASSLLKVEIVSLHTNDAVVSAATATAGAIWKTCKLDAKWIRTSNRHLQLLERVLDRRRLL